MSVPAPTSLATTSSRDMDRTRQATPNDPGPDNPTAEMAAAFTNAFDYYNEHLFSGTLPPCLITLQRRSRTLGYFSKEQFARTSQTNGMPTTDEIALNPEHFRRRGMAETLSTLVHEMVHLAQYHYGQPGRGRYHNREWAEMMKTLGLYPSSTGQPGGNETGDSMSHFIIEGGYFDRVTHDLLARGFSIPWADADHKGSDGTDGDDQAKSGKRVKYTCPVCGLNAWAKADVSILCGTDGVEMPPAEG